MNSTTYRPLYDYYFFHLKMYHKLPCICMTAKRSLGCKRCLTGSTDFVFSRPYEQEEFPPAREGLFTFGEQRCSPKVKKRAIRIWIAVTFNVVWQQESCCCCCANNNSNYDVTRFLQQEDLQ